MCGEAVPAARGCICRDSELRGSCRDHIGPQGLQQVHQGGYGYGAAGLPVAREYQAVAGQDSSRTILRMQACAVRDEKVAERARERQERSMRDNVVATVDI